jgi:hypothetical protein
LQGAVVDTAPD